MVYESMGRVDGRRQGELMRKKRLGAWGEESAITVAVLPPRHFFLSTPLGPMIVAKWRQSGHPAELAGELAGRVPDS